MPEPQILKDSEATKTVTVSKDVFARDHDRVAVTRIRNVEHDSNTNLRAGDTVGVEFYDEPPVLLFERPDGSRFVQKATCKWLRRIGPECRMVGVVLDRLDDYLTAET